MSEKDAPARFVESRRVEMGAGADASPEDAPLDLAELAGALQARFEGRPPRGYVLGRTAFRDALAAHLGCSDVRAERLVAQLEGRGFLRYPGEPRGGPDSRRLAWRTEAPRT